ncbi:MAG: hypothetical protein H7288_13505 [Kineosporiaceae bacterium]|nr:hypothetical protein [Aeromicrobium sp.]
MSPAWDLTRRFSPREQVRVMKRDAYQRLDENSYPSSFRVGPHAPTTPWAMYLADESGLFRAVCFDFDGKDKNGIDPDLMEQAVDDCDALSRILDELTIEHVVCQSSGTGGRHLWVALASGVSSELVARIARSARASYRTLDHGMLLNPRTGAARPPLSPHRDGSTSTILRGTLTALLSPTITPTDLVQLATVLETRKPALRPVDSAPSGPVTTHRVHRELSRAGTAHMATIDGGGNPSWTGFMCLLAAAHAGWNLVDVEQAARTAPGMEHYRTRNTGRAGARRPRTATDAHTRLSRQWAKAQHYATLHQPLPAVREPADLTELTGIVTDVDALMTRFRVSPGRWGHSEVAVSQRSILTAVAYLTLHTGKRTVAASIRDLALMTALGRTTAATALHALTSDGYLRQITTADGGNAAEWALTSNFSTTPRTVRSQPLNNPRPPTELFIHRSELVAIIEEQLTDQRHDLFTRTGLGHLAGRTYALLRQVPSLTVESAARQLGVSLRHTATILSRLRKHRLIITHPQGWARAKRDLRDQAARTLGVLGVLVDRARRYRAEREVWAWWQAELATMTSAPRARPSRPHVTSRTLVDSTSSGERWWPRYPRGYDGRADHREARYWAINDMLAPDSLWFATAA